jgi:hypothetical protein
VTIRVILGFNPVRVFRVTTFVRVNMFFGFIMDFRLSALANSTLEVQVLAL